MAQILHVSELSFSYNLTSSVSMVHLSQWLNNIEKLLSKTLIFKEHCTAFPPVLLGSACSNSFSDFPCFLWWQLKKYGSDISYSVLKLGFFWCIFSYLDKGYLGEGLNLERKTTEVKHHFGNIISRVYIMDIYLVIIWLICCLIGSSIMLLLFPNSVLCSLKGCQYVQPTEKKGVEVFFSWKRNIHINFFIIVDGELYAIVIWFFSLINLIIHVYAFIDIVLFFGY
jgi:hypothetical protein